MFAPSFNSRTAVRQSSSSRLECSSLLGHQTHFRQRQCSSLQQRTSEQRKARLCTHASLTEPVSRPEARDQQQAGRKQSRRLEAPSKGKTGVLLLNLGGPETLADVRPFLYNLFADPDIIRLPSALKFLQPILANVIATLRTPKSSEGYASIGGGSPLRKITDEQAHALALALRARGMDAEVYVAMRYWHPYTEEALQHVVRDGISNLVILPLYPQFSISTSGSSLRLLEHLFKSDPVLQNLKHTVIPSWYQRPGYVAAMVDLIEAELDKFEQPQEVNVFFSAHGVPKSYVEEAGDPYKEEMEECVALIMDELRRRGRGNEHTLAYQSRVGPVEWLQPYTDDSIRELGAKGVKSLLAVPISFVSEHIETLEEIDMEYRELALESGVQRWGRVPALNTNQRFIDDLADAVVEALPYVGVIAGAPSDALVPMGELWRGAATDWTQATNVATLGTNIPAQRQLYAHLHRQQRKRRQHSEQQHSKQQQERWGSGTLSLDRHQGPAVGSAVDALPVDRMPAPAAAVGLAAAAHAATALAEPEARSLAHK